MTTLLAGRVMRPTGNALGAVLAASFLLVAGACNDSPTKPVEGVPTEVVFSTSEITLESLQDSFAIGVTVFDGVGNELSDVEVQWEISDSSVVERIAESSFRSIGNGSASLTISSLGGDPYLNPDGYYDGRIAGSVAVVVAQRPTALAILPSDSAAPGSDPLLLWYLGQEAELAAVPIDALANPVVGAAAVTAAWNSDDPAISEVDTAGRITALSEGITTIDASGDGLTGSREVEVDATLELTVCVSVAGTESGCDQGSLTFAIEGS